jgi:hypothetical protein
VTGCGHTRDTFVMSGDTAAGQAEDMRPEDMIDAIEVRIWPLAQLHGHGMCVIEQSR